MVNQWGTLGRLRSGGTGELGDARVLHYHPGGADNLRILYHSRKQGKGAAIRTGLRRCRGEYAVLQWLPIEPSRKRKG